MEGTFVIQSARVIALPALPQASAHHAPQASWLIQSLICVFHVPAIAMYAQTLQHAPLVHLTTALMEGICVTQYVQLTA